MSTQSFPPRSTLKRLSSYNVQVNIQLASAVPERAIEEAVLEAVIIGKLAERGVKVVQSGNCDARLNVSVMVLEAARAGPVPLSYCFTVFLTVQTIVLGSPNEDLFIVYEGLNLGLSGPVTLTTRVLGVATDMMAGFADCLDSFKKS